MAWKKAQITKRELCFVENTLTFLPQQMLDIYDFFVHQWLVCLWIGDLKIQCEKSSFTLWIIVSCEYIYIIIYISWYIMVRQTQLSYCWWSIPLYDPCYPNIPKHPSGDWEPASSGGMWPAGPAWPATRLESNADDGMMTTMLWWIVGLTWFNMV